MSRLKSWGKRLEEHPLWAYTLAFGLAFGLVFGPFFLSHKTFVYQADSYVQHYPSFLYYGEKLREAFGSLFAGKGFQFPQWEYSIGLGTDVISTLSYYIIGEPIALISALFPAQLAPYGYSLMIALRLYLAGLLFCAFLRERGCGVLPGTIAAVCYVFSGYGLRPAIFHSAFSIPMVGLPLLLLGVERLYKKKDPKVFILAVFYSAVSSFYFFYMLVILVVLYAVLRYLFLFWGQPLRCLFGWVLRFLLAALAGAALAAPILLPCIYSVLNSERLLAVQQELLLYGKDYFTHYAAGLLSVYEYKYFYVALSGPVIPLALLTLTAPRGKNREEKLCMAVLFLFTLVPFFGSMFNAFSYVTNRWIWAFIAGICFCFARGLSILDRLSGRQLAVTGGLLALLTGLCLLPAVKGTTWLQLALMWGAYLAALLYARRERLGALLPKVLRAAVPIMTAAGVLVTGGSLFWPRDNPNYSNYMSRTQANAKRLGVVEPLLETVAQDMNCRTDSSFYQPYNRAILSGRGTMSYYFSMIDPGTTRFQGAVYYNRSCGQQYTGPRGQSMLMSLLGVRYYAVEPGRTDSLPYGFDTLIGSNKSCDIYENSYALPLVTVYDTVAAPEDAGSPLALEQLMLQAAVTQEEVSLPRAETDLTVRELPYTWRGQDARLEEGLVRVDEDQGSLELEFDPIEGMELCVVFDGLESDTDNPMAEMFSINAVCGGTANSLQATRPVSNFYCGYKDFLISLGYQREKQDSIQLTFSCSGDYRFDSMKLYAVDPSFLEEASLRLRNSGVGDISRETNRISFSTRRDAARMAFISVPYNENWSVTVDGSEVPLRNVQCSMCGVEVPAGEHRVEMTYSCRPFWLGAAVSGAMLALLLVLWVWRKRAGRRGPA